MINQKNIPFDIRVSRGCNISSIEHILSKFSISSKQSVCFI